MKLQVWFGLFISIACSDIEILSRQLLANYDKRISATENDKWSKIYVAIDLIWLSSVDTASSKYYGIYIIEMFWYDQRLKWNLNQFNLSGLTFDLEHLWHPKINFFDWSAGDNSLDMKSLVAEITSDGRVRGESYCISYTILYSITHIMTHYVQ